MNSIDSIRPVIYVSRCLGFDKCRWNGDTINDTFVNKLRDFVEFHDVCPETDIGLGIPRNPVRLVRSDDGLKMMQPATGEDVTAKMIDHCSKVLNSIDNIDGFLLKNASPSCGINNIKVYASIKKGSMVSKSMGLFAGMAQDKFPNIPMEDEGRLHNFVIRENWLIAIYAIAGFRELENSQKISELYKYHTNYKYLFMSYSQKKMKELGHLLANHDKLPAKEIFSGYKKGLLDLIRLKPSNAKRINVLMHMMGYFSKHLKASEKQYFLNLLEEFRRGTMPLAIPLEIIKSWALRFENDYILNQKILHSYPKDLLLLSDSGKGRDLKR